MIKPSAEDKAITPPFPGEVPPPRLLVIPDDVNAELDTPFSDTASETRPARRPSPTIAYVLAGAIAGAGALYAAGSLLPWRGADPRLTRAQLPPPASSSSIADTLSLALASFDLRVRLFQSKQMECADLQRGLVLVEERWTAYNTARGHETGALDSTREARDRSLYASVDDVERRFERSACPRP